MDLLVCRALIPPILLWSTRPSKVAWKLVCLPKAEGGLGVLNLQTQDEAVLLKNLHKFFNKHDLPWVNLIRERHYNNGSLPSVSQRHGSFWWSDILKLLDSFKGMAMVNVFSGKTCLFWDDLWLNRVPKHHYPHLYSFAKALDISLFGAFHVSGPNELFNLPLSQVAASQLVELAGNLNSLTLSEDNDIWSYIWGSPFFSTSKAYIHLTGHMPTNPMFRWLWK